MGRLLGRLWLSAMLVTAVSSFWIYRDGFSWIHGLSLWTILCLVLGLAAIRRGEVEDHARWVVSAYVGILVAFAFTFEPGRLMHQWVLGPQGIFGGG